MTTRNVSVAVVGAGVAGLAAADSLLRSGMAVTILEARPRLGGRIDTRYDFAPSPIERGAEFVHGRHEELVRRIREADLHLEERRFEPLMLQNGTAITQPTSWEKVFDALADPDAPDVPIAARVREFLASGRWSEADARRLRRYVEGYMAADVDRVSARALSQETRAAQAIDDDGNATIREGYDALVRSMGRCLDHPAATLLLQTAVERISWRAGAATLDVRRDAAPTTRTLPFDRVLVTIPLGFLQAGPEDPDAVRFEPAIAHIRRAARCLAMGNVVKLFLHFRSALGDIPGVGTELAARLASARFLQTPDASVPTWWRVGSDDAPILVGWCGGAVADRFSGQTEQQVIEAGIESLSSALGVATGDVRASIVDATVADWSTERWSRGAYSWIPAGALDASAILSTPVADTLFFAGEATDTSGFRGTVHGALETGLRAARQILDSVAVPAATATS